MYRSEADTALHSRQLVRGGRRAEEELGCLGEKRGTAGDTRKRVLENGRDAATLTYFIGVPVERGSAMSQLDIPRS